MRRRGALGAVDRRRLKLIRVDPCDPWLLRGIVGERETTDHADQHGQGKGNSARPEQPLESKSEHGRVGGVRAACWQPFSSQGIVEVAQHRPCGERSLT